MLELAVLRRCSAAVVILVLLLGRATSVGAAEYAREGERPPNVVLLFTDDQRFDSLHAFGNPVIQTPELDRLSEQGTVFTNAFVTTAICCISRATLITGQYARRNGIVDFGTPLSPEALAETFPLQLRTAGYRTGFIGKWGLGNPLPEEAYDYWRGFPGQGNFFDDSRPGVHLTDLQGDEAVEFIDGCSADRPFCLQVSFKAPHCQDLAGRQFPPAARLESLYADMVMPIAPTANEVAFERLPEFLRNSEARVRWERRFATPEMYQATVKDYFRLITGVDEVVGRIRQRLTERGLAENTVVIFTSDHGFYLGEHGLAGKWFMHEESIRVPLVIYDPRRTAGEHVAQRDEMVLNVDLAPTILELANVRVPEVMQGTSLVPLIEGRDVPWRDRWLYEHHFAHRGIPQSEGVRTERWKYVRYLLDDGDVEQLYDLASDPHEEHDLVPSGAHAAQLSILRGQWHALAEQAK